MLRTRGGRRITAHGTGPVAASFRLPTLPSADSQGTSLWVQRFSAGLDRVPKGAEAPLPPEAKSRPGAARPPAAGCARPPRSRRAVYRRDAAATRVFETSFVSSRREISAQDQEGYGHPEAGVGPAECLSGEAETSVGPAGGPCTTRKRCSVTEGASTAAVFGAWFAGKT